LDDDSVTQNYYIATESSPADDRTRVLKYGKTFAVFDRYGDIETVGLREEGIFCEGTRFLSQLEFQLAYARPLLLSSTIKADNSQFAVDMANVDISRNGEVVIPRGTLHVLRTKFLWSTFRLACFSQFLQQFEQFSDACAGPFVLTKFIRCVPAPSTVFEKLCLLP